MAIIDDRDPPFTTETSDSQNSRRFHPRHYLFSLLIFGLVVLVSGAASRLVTHDDRNVLEGARVCRDHPALMAQYRKLIEADFRNLDNHRGYLDAHLSISKIKRNRSSANSRNDKAIVDQYVFYTKSSDLKVRDIGNYGLGYFYARDHQPQKALGFLRKISDPKMAYLNNTLGYIYLYDIKRPDLAKDYFLKEISLKGNIRAAVLNLSKLFWEGGKYRDLDSLSHDANLGSFFPIHYLRYLQLEEKRYPDYFLSLCKTEFNFVTFETLLTSLVIALMFLVYVYFIDVFEKEKISLLVVIFSMGILSAFLSTFFYDLASAFFNYFSTGDDLHDLGYFIFGVGLIEETSKALPVLIVVFLLKEWSEPVDILIYAAVSALGFACMENVGYFSGGSAGLIMGRTLSAVVMHVCLTTLAVYGIFYYRHGKGSLGSVYIFASFAAAVLAHGLYDFFIASSMGLGILSTVILIYMMIIFRNMIENGLDQSPGLGSTPLTVNLSVYLFYGLLAILSMQFSILGVRYGLPLSLRNLWSNLLGFYILSAILISGFGKMRLVKNKWRSLFDRST